MVGVLAGNIHPFYSTLPNITDFFTYLIKAKKLSPRTVDDYKSALNTVLKLSLNINISDDPTISDLFKGFVAQTDPVVDTESQTGVYL